VSSVFKVNNLVLINAGCPANAGRIVHLVKYIGSVEVPNMGEQILWEGKPISGVPLVTVRSQQDGTASEKIYVPEKWMTLISIDDPLLDDYLEQLHEDETLLRNKLIDKATGNQPDSDS
jgi:hypothetical protein